MKTKLRKKIENAVIRQELSHRGGGMEITLSPFGYKGEKMTAYQNYLGGGMLGKICNDCTIDNWEKKGGYYEERTMPMIMKYGNYALEEIAEELSKFMHDLTNPDCEWAGTDFIGNLNRPVSAY